ncbi:cytochrome c oxidase subunit I [Anaerolinea sp.]|uniref:cytochrome c oxidase subunit I n=1 Tax=Anaerolinea sp. TaxID=1872519 RepID=UPI002ACE517E|nr:cbb3-type cytochrome c oxidase subunit I [Anaerolinea sp.]
MKKIFQIGLLRGIFGQILGMALGYGLVTTLQLLSGARLRAEPAWVVGGAFGAMGFLIALGAFTDWFRMAKGDEVPEPEEIEEPQDVRRYWGLSYDHKVIGVQYGFLSLFLLVLGGLFGLVFRTELLAPQLQFLSFNLFNTLIGLHGMVLIASILMGIAAVSNYVIPLLIGARDMAFPRLNAFSFWVAVPGALILLWSLALGGFETGWTGYPPLSIRGPMGVQMFFLGVWFVGWSSILGALNLIATILRMRAPGMSMFRMPILAWSVLATSIIALTATQLIGLSFQLVLFERLLGMGFFEPSNGGNPILFQHLFWFYSHPAVYIFVLPGLGIISELLPVFVRKPLFGYKWVAMSSLGIALVGFLVWAHHMFAAGMEEYLRVPFMYSTLLVAVPTGVKFFSWTATIWQGNIRLRVPMLFVLGGIIIFLLGGITGPLLGTVSTNLHLTDTYYVVGHFHATMFGGYVFPFFAALYYWFPKITGRQMSEKLGKWHFWLLFIGFMVMSLGQMRIGMLGMRRRIADYDPAMGFQLPNIIITLAGFMVALSVLILFINLYRSARFGQVATGNVWQSRSPEWQIPSPTPAHNYPAPLRIVGEPYDYAGESQRYVEVDGAVPAAHAAD